MPVVAGLRRLCDLFHGFRGVVAVKVPHEELVVEASHGTSRPEVPKEHVRPAFC